MSEQPLNSPTFTDLFPTPASKEKLSYAAEGRSPAIDELSLDAYDLKRFQAKINELISVIGGSSIRELKPLSITQEGAGTQTRLYIKYNYMTNNLSEGKLKSISHFFRDILRQTVYSRAEVRKHEGYQIPHTFEVKSPSNILHRIKNVFHMLFKPVGQTTFVQQEATTHQKEANRFSLSVNRKQGNPLLGFFSEELQKRIGQFISIPTSANEITLILNPSNLTEADIAYFIVQLSTIINGNVDYAGDGSDLNIRRTTWLKTYHKLLEDQYTHTSETDIVGLETQLEEIETQLITPLATGKGTAKNIALVGPPGTGKTLSIRHLMTNHPEVMFVPMKVSDFYSKDKSGKFVFENSIAKLQKLSNRMNIPFVVVIDDAEGLFGSAIDQESGLAGGINASDRSRILEILNGRGDSGFKSVLSLNHPEILDEAAKRRLYQVGFNLPDYSQRTSIAQSLIKNLEKTLSISDSLKQTIVETIAKKTAGLNSAYISDIIDQTINSLLYLEHKNVNLNSLGDDEVKKVLESAIAAIKSQNGQQGQLGFRLPN